MSILVPCIIIDAMIDLALFLLYHRLLPDYGNVERGEPAIVRKPSRPDEETDCFKPIMNMKCVFR